MSNEKWYKQILKEIKGKDCYKFKDWSPEKTDNACIVDVGANVGAFSVMAAEKFPKATIYAFELVKENYDFAITRTRNYKNIKLFNKALVGSNLPIGLFKNEHNHGGHKAIFDDTTETYLNSNDFDAPFAEQKVESISVLQLFDEYSIEQIDFLKLDCEGSEYEILFHVNEHGLWDKISRISMELHGRGDKPRVDKLMKMLRENYSNVTLAGKNLVHCEK